MQIHIQLNHHLLGLPDGVPGAFGSRGHKGEDPVGVLDDERVPLERGASPVFFVVGLELHQRDVVQCGVLYGESVGPFRSSRNNQINFLRLLDFGDLGADKVIVLELTRTHDC